MQSGQAMNMRRPGEYHLHSGGFGRRIKQDQRLAALGNRIVQHLHHERMRVIQLAGPVVALIDGISRRLFRHVSHPRFHVLRADVVADSWTGHLTVIPPK
jgi:hypothetical protein